MTTKDNHRKNERQIHSMRIIYSEEKTGKCNPVRLLNFSKTGIYFESLDKIVPGTRIRIHTKGGTGPEHEADPVCSGYKTMARVLVKWCKKIEDRNYPYFGIGGEYLE